MKAVFLLSWQNGTDQETIVKFHSLNPVLNRSLPSSPFDIILRGEVAYVIKTCVCISTFLCNAHMPKSFMLVGLPYIHDEGTHPVYVPENPLRFFVRIQVPDIQYLTVSPLLLLRPQL